MKKKDWMKLLHKSTFGCNYRQYRVIVYSRYILPELEEFRKYIVNDGSMLRMPKEFREYISYDGSVPITFEDWKEYIAYNGSVPFIFEELKENIIYSDELPFIRDKLKENTAYSDELPSISREYIVYNDGVLLMLDELRKYLVDNDMVRFMPEERWKYIEKMERRNKEPEQFTVKQIFDDTVIDEMNSKTTKMICWLDELCQWKDGEDQEKVTALQKDIEYIQEKFRYEPKFSYMLDCLGAKVAEIHAYTVGYEQMMMNSKQRENVMHGKRKYVYKTNEILGKIYKNAGFCWNTNKNKKNLENLYVGLVKRYGTVINADILCFFYIVYKLDWKEIKGKKKEAESNIIATLFCADDKSDEVPENLQSIYKECFGQLSEGNDIYIELYDIVLEDEKGKEWEGNVTITDIDRRRKFLMKMYVEIIIRIRYITGGRGDGSTRCLIEKRAAPFFCNVLCSVEKYERMKIISLMMQLTKSMMLTEDDGQQGTVRSGCTDYFRVLYRYMILYSETLNKNIMDLSNFKVNVAWKQCQRALRKEFREITIPEWSNDKKLSSAAKRFNCMMLMGCFITCKQYQDPSAYSKLLYWLRRIRGLYEYRMQDLHIEEHDWISIDLLKDYYGILLQSYCKSIADGFVHNLAVTKINVKYALGNSIWRFQQKSVDIETLNKPINEEYWLEDGSPWISKDDFNSMAELKEYLESNSNLEIVPTLRYA